MTCNSRQAPFGVPPKQFGCTSQLHLLPPHLTIASLPPQMANMYGEVMELNSELHKQIQEREKDIQRLRLKLLHVCCVSPAPVPLPG